MASKCKNWIYTLNNYTTEEEDTIKSLYGTEFKYTIYGREIAPTTGTPHLQGYIQFIKQYRLQEVKNHFIDRAHYEPAKGNVEDNINYTSKDEKVITYGTPTIQGSNKNKLYAQIQQCNNWNEVLEIKGIQRSLRYAQEVFKLKPIPKMENFKPRKWQQSIIDILEKPTDGRTIYYVYDKKGNTGKTYLCKYLVANHNAFYTSPAKSSDILYAYNNQKVVLYDIPKSQDEAFINYGALEKLKDGIYFNGKYDSSLRYRHENIHIIVFSNNEPPTDKFSEDRLKIINLSK